MTTPGPRTVTLYDTTSPGYSRGVWATLAPGGGLTVSGQSLTRDEDLHEYEWSMTVPAPNVPALAAALTGDATADVLAALAALFAADGHANLQKIFKAHDIGYEFWSRAGG